MPSTIEVSAWLYELQYNALDRALKQCGAGSIEQELQRLIAARYNELIPAEQQRQIEQEQRRQEEAERIAREKAGQYSVLRITENGVARNFESEDYKDMRSLAVAVRRYLRQESYMQLESFAEHFEDEPEIDNHTFLNRQAAFGSSPNITGVFEVDLDAGTVTTWNRKNGKPTSYSTKSISAAAYYSMLSNGSPWTKDRIFSEKLAGKELPAVPEPKETDGPKLTL